MSYVTTVTYVICWGKVHRWTICNDVNGLWQQTVGGRSVTASGSKRCHLFDDEKKKMSWGQTEKSDVRRRTAYIQTRLKAHETNNITHGSAAKCPSPWLAVSHVLSTDSYSAARQKQANWEKNWKKWRMSRKVAIVSPKRCKTVPRLLLITNRKSHTGFRLVSNNQWPWMTLNGRYASISLYMWKQNRTLMVE